MLKTISSGSFFIPIFAMSMKTMAFFYLIYCVVELKFLMTEKKKLSALTKLPHAQEDFLGIDI